MRSTILSTASSRCRRKRSRFGTDSTHWRFGGRGNTCRLITPSGDALQVVVVFRRLRTVANYIFNFAQGQYPDVLLGSPTTDHLVPDYFYRQYENDTCMAVSLPDQQLLFLGPDRVLKTLGSVTDFIPQAGCR